MEFYQTHNRPDQWKFEQGMVARELPVLDQTEPGKTKFIEPHHWAGHTKDEAAIAAIGDREKLFAREREGWKGYGGDSHSFCHQSTSNSASDMWNGRSIRKRR